jgi:hypothetical protein
VTDTAGMLHFQKLDVYRRSIEFLVLAQHARSLLPKGHADLADQLRCAAQCASHLDVMQVDELIEANLYERGLELLERIVAMLTKLVDP